MKKKLTLALVLAAAALAAYGEFRHPNNPLPVDGRLLAQGPPPPLCPPHCPPSKPPKI